MSAKEVYKPLILSGIHLEVREAKKDLAKIKDKRYLISIGEKARRALDSLPFFIGVLNKNQIVGEVVVHYLQLMKNGSDDEIFTSFIMEELEKCDSIEKQEYLKGIIWLAHSNDRRVSQSELDIIHYFFDEIGTKDSNFDSVINEVIDSYSKEAKANKKNYTSNKSVTILTAVSILLVCSIATAAYVYNAYTKKGNEPLKRKLSNISYKKIHFDRYIAAGNYGGGERADQIGKLVVYYIKGTADIEFDLSNLKLTRTATGYSAVYNNPEASSIGFRKTNPFIVDVNINQEDITEILNDTPDSLTEGQIKAAAGVVGAVAAVGGGYVGAKVGAGVGTSIQPPLGAIFGLGAGATIGAGTAGVGSYIMMKKYLTNFQITGAISQSNKDKIFEKSKSLIAAEILLDSDLSEELTADFEEYVKDFYQNLGVSINDITYRS